MKRRSTQAIALCLVATVAFTALDLMTKDWAVEALTVERTGEPLPVCQPNEQGYVFQQRLRKESIVLIEDYLEFQYAENCGAAFGMLNKSPTWLRHAVFGIAGTVASVVLLVFFITGRGTKYFAYAVPFIVSGAIGNLVDRFRLGYVVDFIHFHFKDSWQYPTFNVADITITIGAILLLLEGWLDHKAAKAEEDSAADNSAKKDSAKTVES